MAENLSIDISLGLGVGPDYLLFSVHASEGHSYFAIESYFGFVLHLNLSALYLNKIPFFAFIINARWTATFFIFFNLKYLSNNSFLNGL